MFGLLRYDGVSERAQSVHPSGKPINASTNDGFRPPGFDPSLPSLAIRRTWRPRGGEFRLSSAFDESLLQSRAMGVDHNRAASVSVVPS